jgi:hypothetical protein
VHLCPDSDAATNPNVAEAFRRLGLHLQAYNCDVRIIHLPPGPNGEKVGLDDFLLTHEPSELWELSRRPGDSAVEREREQKERYKAERDELRDRERALFDLLGNPGHEGNARIMQAVTLREYAEHRTEGREQIVIERIAKKAGFSPDAAGRWIARGDAAGVWTRTEGARTHVDGHEYRPVFVEPTAPGDLAAMYRAASLTADAKTVKRGTYHARRCGVCHSDDVRVTARYECQCCGHAWTDAPRDLNPKPKSLAPQDVELVPMLNIAPQDVELVTVAAAPPAIPPPLPGMTVIDLDDETGDLDALQPAHVRPTPHLVELVEPPACKGALGCLQPSYCAKQGHCRWNSTTPRKELQ